MKLTIDKFQQLHSISTLEMNDFDKSIKLVQVLLDKTEQEVEKIPINKFERICKQLEQAFNLNMDEVIKSKPKEIIKANGKRYKLNFELTKEPFNTGRYIEVATFSDGNTIMNMHNILASIAEPMVFNWNKLKWECLPYNALIHEQYADDLRQADFKHGYHALVFFLSIFNEFNTRFKGLFGNSDGEANDEPIAADAIAANFLKSFGWIYNVHLVAEFERIETDKVYDLPVIQFLNDLNYLKQKRILDEHQHKQITAKQS